MQHATLRQLCDGLRAGKFSSVEITQFFINKINKLGSAFNCFISVDAERSLTQARAADALLAAGKAQPLTGVPIAQKDIFCAQGWLTTCGSKMLSNFVSPYDAHVIERFNAAGAVNLGKTNMDEFAMGSSNETSYYGLVRNPWDRERVPGGSSGGSAAAVAARLAPAATGTDTGAFCLLDARLADEREVGENADLVRIPDRPDVEFFERDTLSASLAADRLALTANPPWRKIPRHFLRRRRGGETAGLRWNARDVLLEISHQRVLAVVAFPPFRQLFFDFGGENGRRQRGDCDGQDIGLE